MDDIIQYKITKEKFIKIEHKSHYKLKYVDLNNYLDYTEDFNIIIDLLHKQLKWDGIPTLEECYQRFNSNSFCLLFYYNEKCIGWNWGNPNVTINWIDIDKKLNNNELYLGGCFVSKLVERPADAGIQNYNMFFDYCLNILNPNVMYGYCDNWNKAAIRINISNGWEQFNFL
jgi:hypothetical protein